MKMICFDTKTKEIVYSQFDKSDKERCRGCLDVNDYSQLKQGVCKKKQHLVIRTRTVNNAEILFVFCIGRAKTKKAAGFIAGRYIDVILDDPKIFKNANKHYEEIRHIALHNTKNLHANINTKFDTLFEGDKIKNAEDTIDYIKQSFERDPGKFGKEIFAILKLVNTINIEYTISDNLRPGSRLDDKDFSAYKVFSMIVSSFYIYRNELNQKGIYVNISKTHEKVIVDHDTVNAAFAQIFDNIVKYVKPRTEIAIKFESNNNFIDIIFEMQSLFLTDSDLTNIFSFGFRGENALSSKIKGDGMGLFVVKKMIELNNGEIVFKKDNDSISIYNNVKYSNNSIVVSLKRYIPISRV